MAYSSEDLRPSGVDGDWRGQPNSIFFFVGRRGGGKPILDVEEREVHPCRLSVCCLHCWVRQVAEEVRRHCIRYLEYCDETVAVL